MVEYSIKLTLQLTYYNIYRLQTTTDSYSINYDYSLYGPGSWQRRMQVYGTEIS